MSDFTILMPCLNEADSIAFCIQEAKTFISKYGLDAEILIADNGSHDASADIAKKQGAAVITVEEKGYGAAVLAGIKNAKGKYIIMGDADGSYDFGNLELFVAALQSGYSLVVGNRFRGMIEPHAMPWLHRIGVPILSTLAKWRFHVDVGDFHCGLRGFCREEALQLNLHCPGMEFATELIAAFALNNAKICEVPTILRRDLRQRKSHIRTFRDGLRHLKFIIAKK